MSPRSYSAALAFFFTACASSPAPNPAAGVYGAERLACVRAHDAGDPEGARECMRQVDARYGQDGGLRER